MGPGVLVRRDPAGASAGAAPDGDDALTFHAVDKARWPDFAALFEARGGPKYCWCMAWRATNAEAREMSSRDRRAAIEGRVRAGVPVGILGYRGGTPVAWCSIAPRATYRPLGGVEVPDEPADRVWSIACFFVPRSLRGQGIMPRLLAAAVDHARMKGATVVEAYPVDPDSPSYRFMGFVAAFEAAGFREVGRAGTRRHVMRLDVAVDDAADADVTAGPKGRGAR
jgi:GNAT superfamily N-acetyltransferase